MGCLTAHKLHFSSLQNWQKKQSLQLCFFGPLPSGTYIKPGRPRILIKAILFQSKRKQFSFYGGEKLRLFNNSDFLAFLIDKAFACSGANR